MWYCVCVIIQGTDPEMGKNAILKLMEAVDDSIPTVSNSWAVIGIALYVGLILPHHFCLCY